MLRKQTLGTEGLLQQLLSPLSLRPTLAQHCRQRRLALPLVGPPRFQSTLLLSLPLALSRRHPLGHHRLCP